MEKQLSRESTSRNSSIELLRILSILGVIILHYNNSEMGGAFLFVEKGSINQYYLYFTENLFISSVNIFIIVSGYYLSRTQNRKLNKVFELLIQVVFFQLAFYLIHVIIRRSFNFASFLRCLLPVNYFVILYSVLYLISPYINIALNQLSLKQFKNMLTLLLILFSGCTIFVDYLRSVTETSFDGLSTIGLFGSQKGYTIVNFTLAYLIGAYINRSRAIVSTKKGIIAVSSVLLLMLILSITESRYCHDVVTWYYNNPLCLLMASLIFLLFVNNAFYNKLINDLSKGAFTCFLIHQYFLQYVGIRAVSHLNITFLVAHQIAVCVILYGLSFCVYKVYYGCSHRLIKKMEPFSNKISLTIWKEQ